MKTKMVKNVSKLVFTFGVSSILDGMVKAVCPNMGLVKKACVSATSLMASWMIEEKLTEFTALKVDEVMAYVKEKVKEDDNEMA